MNIPETYSLLKAEHIAECNAEAAILQHKKTGARIFLMKNEDKNRVFTIGFRTPPENSTGLPHILEHSVLCGSRKYPIKDPFIELAKSSLQTFLNAMTYPDKTIYPVASCNEKDFRNLCSVYMDAVLHPAIYSEEKIFRQEGWHYEMADADAPLTINGVVYNEMKGAFSSADDVLERYCQTALYPDTPYFFESGGDPEDIPSLSYEEFLAFHSRYYHPSNSFIYLYGDLDMEEQLAWLDAEYLSGYEKKEIDSRIPLQPAFDKIRDMTVEYPLAEGEDPKDKYYFSWQWVTGKITDPLEYVAFQVLESALLSTPGAPLRQALEDAELGEEIYGGYQNGSLQPYFSLVAKNAGENRKEEFIRIIRDTLTKEVTEGIDRTTLEGAMNLLEFKNREADYGPYPKGLVYGIECFDSWLYDEDPAIHLKYEETFKTLRDKMKTSYFEDLIRTYFLDNPHSALITLKPVPGMTEKKDAELAEKLAAKKKAMSPEEIEAMVSATAELKAYQDAPSTPEQIATLPRLTLSDIESESRSLCNRPRVEAGIPVICHEIFTSGIIYSRFLFRVDRIEKEEIPYLSLLRFLLSLMNTKEYSYRQLTSQILLHTGGIGVSLPSYQNAEDPEDYSPYIELNCRALKDKLPMALELMKEIMLRTDFSDLKRLKSQILELRSRVLSGLIGGGHSTAVSRAGSYCSSAAKYGEMIGGVDYLHFLTDLLEQMESEEGAQAAADKLASLARKLFVKSGMMVSLTAAEEDYALFAKCLADFASDFPEGESSPEKDIFRRSHAKWPMELSKKNEGFATAGQIQYVGLAGSFRRPGLPYTGSLKVLRGILGDEYLWTNVRVKGGAYGCMCGFGRTGNGYLVSYRDPNLKETLKIYQDIVPYLEAFDCSLSDMTGYIIGTIGSLDRPMNPAEAGRYSFQAYMSGITEEILLRERQEILSTDVMKIRDLAPYVEAVLESNLLCVVGNAGRLEQDSDLFGRIETLK